MSDDDKARAEAERRTPGPPEGWDTGALPLTVRDQWVAAVLRYMRDRGYVVMHPGAPQTTLPSVEDVARIKAEALREAAEVWGDSTWSDVWLADGVDDDVSAVQSTVRWLNTRAAQVERGESDE